MLYHLCQWSYSCSSSLKGKDGSFRLVNPQFPLTQGLARLQARKEAPIIPKHILSECFASTTQR